MILLESLMTRLRPNTVECYVPLENRFVRQSASF